MKNYKNSDYAINKYSKAIVYRFADGKIEYITLEKYLSQNPCKTKDDFQALKRFSNENYHEQDHATRNQTRKNISIHSLEDTGECASKSLEDDFFNEIEEKYLENVRLLRKILTSLTDTQRKRYLLYVCKGMTTREIAQLEGVSQHAVMGSLELTEKKIKIFLEKDFSKRPKNDDR